MLFLTDGRGMEVDADVFEELLQRGNLTINVSVEKSTGKLSLDRHFCRLLLNNGFFSLLFSFSS